MNFVRTITLPDASVGRSIFSLPAASTVVCHVFRLPGITNPKSKSQTSMGSGAPSRYTLCSHRRFATFSTDENVSSRLTAGH